MRVGQAYSLVLTVTGLGDRVREVRFWNFTTVAPAPVVSIVRRGSTLRITNAQPYPILTFIEDRVPGLSPAFNWSCVAVNSSSACATLSNTSLQQLWIPRDYPTGTYQITFDYKSGAASSTVQVTVVANEIPSVRIVMTSVPLVAMPVTYLPSQTILFAAAVVFNGSCRVTWKVNGLAAPSITRTLVLSAARLNPGVDNMIYAKATSTSDETVFGEATFVVTVTPRYDLSLTVRKLGDNAATSATAITDQLVLTAVSNITAGGAPSGAAYQFNFGFFTSGRFAPLRVTPSGSDFVADAPALGGSDATAAVIFVVMLKINGIGIASQNQTFNVTKATAAAAAAQVAQANQVTDPNVALDVANNLRALIANNASMAVEAASAMVTMLSNSVDSSSASSLSGSQQGAIFDSLAAALNSSSSSPASSMGDQAATLLSNIVSSSSFDPSNGPAALSAISQINASQGSSIATTLANGMANDPNLPVGQPTTITSPTITLSFVKQSAADLGNTTVTTGGAQFTVPQGIQMTGVNPDDIVSVASASFATNPYGASSTGANPDGNVVSYQFSVNGGSHPVSGLDSTPLQIGLSGNNVNGVCQFWNTTTNSWSSAGVQTVVVNGVLTCSTNHLTAFASFAPSSASAVAVSLLVMLLVTSLQAMLW
jgi:hypothetical protein